MKRRERKRRTETPNCTMHRHVCDYMLPAICCSFDKVTMSTTFSVGLILSIILISNAEISSTSGSAEEKVQDDSHKTLIRNKRQELTLCSDGTYQHDGRNCCRCAAGERVQQHCTSKPDDRNCEICEKNTYSDQPNAEMFCKPCTSCDHPNANLETEEACTTGRDAKCRCKPDHYCSSNSIGMCIICQPCHTCASSGNKELCARHCKEETSNVGAIVGGVLVAVVLAAIVVGVICWKRRSNSSSPNIPSVEMPLHVPEVDMQPLLPDIAYNLGWSNMKDVALRSGISQNVIEAVKFNHPRDYEEMTLDLLGRWVESRGKSASKDLIEKLHDMGKKDTSEKILEIFRKANPVAFNSSV